MPTFRRTLAATFAAIVAALLIALAPAATAKPKPPQPPPLPERQLDPGTERDPVFKKMLAYREWYRTTFRISPGSNVAVFHFKYPNGAEGYWAIHSDPGKNTPDAPTGHSEKRAMRIMRSLGIDTDTVDKMLSELETCNLPGRKCKTMVARQVRYRLRVSNVTPAAVHGVLVCDQLSSELVFVRANRPRQLRDGRSCWRIPRIAGGRSTDISVTARVLDGARGSMRNTATVSMPGRPDVARIRRQRTFRVRSGGASQPAPTPRPGGVTG